MKKLHHYLSKKVQILPYNKEESRTIGKQLSDGELEELSVYRLYCDYLNDLKVDYKLCIGRSRFNGGLDPDFVSLRQINYTFLSFKDEEGSPHFIFPKSTDEDLRIDEVPYEITNTLVLEFDPRRTKDYQFIKIATRATALNSAFVEEQWNASLSDEMLTITAESRLKGYYSSDFNYWLYPIENEAEGKEIVGELIAETYQRKPDSVYYEIDPDETRSTLRYGLSKPDALLEIDEGLYSLDLSMVRKMFIKAREYDDNERKLDFYNTFTGTEMYKIKLTFDTPVELVDGDKNVMAQNEFGTLNFSVKQQSDRVITIMARYVESTSLLPKDQYDRITLLKQKAEEANRTKLVIKAL